MTWLLDATPLPPAMFGTSPSAKSKTPSTQETLRSSRPREIRFHARQEDFGIRGDQPLLYQFALRGAPPLVPRRVHLRRLHHARYFMATLCTGALEHQVAVALLAREFDDLHRTAALRAEHVLENPFARLPGNRAPKRRRLRCELFVCHAG